MHAPGPWQLDEVQTSCGRAFRIGTGEMLTAGKGCCIIYDDYGGGENQRKANARLIATAPDLLDACKVALGHMTGGMDGDWRDCDPRRLLLDVIDRAEGRVVAVSD